MKRKWILAVLLETVQFACAEVVDSEVKRAIWRTGADTKVAFRVLDDLGMPVADTKVDVGFWMPWEEYAGVDLVTDDKGEAVAEGRSSGEVLCSFTKDGYYRSHLHYHLYKLPGGGLKNGRWQPYGMTNVVEIRKIIHPVQMSVGYSIWGLTVPEKNVHVGFDLEKWDWVKPNGGGIHSDVMVKFNCTNKTDVGVQRSVWARLDIVFTNVLDGAYIDKLCMGSEFRSAYHANTNACFEKEFVFTQNGYSRTAKIESLKEDEYLVFRVRTKLDSDGRIREARYGKIYGDFDLRRGLSFKSYFNPTPNDTNLECDTRKNLLKDKRGRPLPIAAP